MDNKAFQNYLANQNAQLQQLPDPNTMQTMFGSSPAPQTQLQPLNVTGALKQYASQAQGGVPSPVSAGFTGDLKALPQNALRAAQDVGDQAFNALCQKFVEEATYGRSGLFPSAYAAYRAQQKAARTDYQNIKPGDLLYFAPDASNGYSGHTGIYTGNGQMVSATYGGVKQSNVSQWLQGTGQQILGYIPVGR